MFSSTKRIGFAGITLSAIVVSGIILNPPVEAITLQASVENPVRLMIPAIKIDAVIEQVGLTPEGRMDAPKGPTTVGWFLQGPRPGEEGSAVIAGHSGWKNNTPAVFDNLDTLRPGDTISVGDEKGMVTTFVVREVRNYKQYDESTDVFTSPDDKVHLNLITCEGVWDAALENYPDRLVVFTDEK